MIEARGMMNLPAGRQVIARTGRVVCRGMIYHALIVSVLFLSGCRTISPPSQVYPVVPQKIYLNDLCDRQKLLCQWDSITQIVHVNKGDVGAKILIGSDIAFVGNERVLLSAPVKIIDSAVVVPLDFKSKIVNRLDRKKPKGTADYSFPKFKSIVIDAGHGGKDPGAMSKNGTKEKSIVLDIAKRLKKILMRRGLKVVMTRKTDKFISLQRRTEIASRSKADLFISVHANSNPVRGVHGLEVYSLRDLLPLEQKEAQRQANQHILFKALAMKKNAPELEAIVSDILYSFKQAQSKILAAHVAQKTSRHIRSKNIGAKQSRFYVLRNTLIPAILVEVGFLTNPKEEKLLRNSVHRQKIAEGLAKSILEYANK